tara:strand:- start:146 stop:427 length:282 start_codon:yes stop_codon:yes gene_type:complete
MHPKTPMITVAFAFVLFALFVVVVVVAPTTNDDDDDESWGGGTCDFIDRNCLNRVFTRSSALSRIAHVFTKITSGIFVVVVVVVALFSPKAFL